MASRVGTRSLFHWVPGSVSRTVSLKGGTRGLGRPGGSGTRWDSVGLGTRWGELDGNSVARHSGLQPASKPTTHDAHAHCRKSVEPRPWMPERMPSMAESAHKPKSVGIWPHACSAQGTQEVQR